MMIAMSEQETIGVLEVYEDVTMREARLDEQPLSGRPYMITGII